MTFHVLVDGGSGDELYGTNLDQETLDERFLEPYREGRTITWNGRSVAADAILAVRVYETDGPVVVREVGWSGIAGSGNDITNSVITGPPGLSISGVRAEAAPDPGVERDPRRVMIVHGRNAPARDAMATFLRSLSLEPVLWEDAVEETGVGSPHNLEAVEAAMKVAQAVVVIFTAEDEAQVIARFRDPDAPEEAQLQGQPRPNVFLEAGMAMGLGRDRTILTRLGNFRGASDVDGLNAISLNNSPQPRGALRRRLVTAQCAVNDREHYLNPGQAGDFDAALVTTNDVTTPAPEAPSSSGIDVRQKLRLMLFEFGSMRETLSDAKERRVYATAFRLPADEWARSHEELTKHPELDELMDTVKGAYERAHQFNVLVGPHMLEDLTVREDDPINETLEAVATAEAALKAEIARRTPQ